MVYLQSYIFIYHLSSCPSPPWLRGSPGARQGELCTCMTQRLRIHQPVSLFTALQTWLWINPAFVRSSDEDLDVWDVVFYWPVKTAGKGRRNLGLWAGSKSVHCAHAFPSLCTFLALGDCQHMLCIRKYAIQFISLYFVLLSGLLITSILSLKCKYGHHVMFSMEIHLVQKAWRDALAWQGFHRLKTKNTL